VGRLSGTFNEAVSIIGLGEYQRGLVGHTEMRDSVHLSLFVLFV
jgi:hypothetical protein